MGRITSQSKVLCDKSPQKPFYTEFLHLHGRVDIRLSVMVTDECPNSSLTTFGSMPASMHRVA